MSGPAIVPQLSLLDWTEPPWCERTQDMSGFVMPDSTTTSPLLDEQLSISFSIAQNEIDFDIQHPDQSTRDFNLEDPSEAVLGEDFIMFDNMNYSLHSKIDIQPDTSSTIVEEITRPTNSNDCPYFMPMVDLEHSFTLKSPKMDIKPFVKKPGYLSIFDNEEPLIKEDPELSTCCSDNKTMFDQRDDIEVAQEVVVTSYDEHNDTIFKFDESPFLFGSVSCDPPIDIKEEVCNKPDSVKQEMSCDSKIAFAIDNFSFNMDFEEDMMLANISSFAPTTVPMVQPKLHLDIEAAASSSNHLFGEGLPDTPEVLKPVLKPGSGFDLVSFLLANGDSNNKVNPIHPKRPSVKRLQERRRGKSNLLLSNHKASEKKPIDPPSPPLPREILEPTPGPSSAETVARRPARKSAMKLRKLMEEGFLRSSPHSSDDEEDLTTKSKRRPSVSSSTSSRRRLNSDSDHSSNCEDGAKYRERRDRNNLSSKLSRQKRKVKTEQKKVEMKELEAKNSRLRKRADELSALLKKVHTAWQEYLVNIKKEK